jgi:hypothetical protein
MNDRERLTRVRETVQTMLAEYEHYPKPITSTQGTYLMIRMRESLLEIRRLTGCLACGVREPDGSNLFCTQCWILTSDGSRADG